MRAKPQTCVGCACHSHGSDFSAIEGTGSSGVLLCGEASGEHEQREGTPFVPFAPAGGLLERILRRMAVDRQQLSVTNVLRCRPRNNWLDGAPWEYAAISQCRANLDAAIAARRPRAIVALGGIATRELTGMAGDKQGVSYLAGYCLRGPNGTPTVPSFHPAFIRRGKASHTGVLARNITRALNVAKGTDRSWLWDVDPADPLTWGMKQYITRPTVGRVEEFYWSCYNNPNLAIAMDIETPESASMDEDAREQFADTEIRQIQFSTAADTGIAMPWSDGFREWAIKIMHLPNPKYGHNWDLYDFKVLRAAAAREGWTYAPTTRVFDTLDMFHHWQPDLPAHLQFACQFIQFEFPWKHLHTLEHEPFYGCADVDSDWQLGEMLIRTLKRDELFGNETIGYVGQVQSVRPVLAAMEDRGLPIDDLARVRLGDEFEKAQVALGRELSGLAAGLGRVHPKEGYKGTPPQVKALFARGYEGGVEDESFLDDGEQYHYELRMFDHACVDAAGEPMTIPVQCWCRVYDFNPNSAQQLIQYMKAKKHLVPKSRKNEDADGNAKDTTEKKELVRLAHKTGDTFYLKVIEYREFGKAKGTYVDGFAPAPDGCVHATFTFDTGTGQLAAKNPNVTNFPKRARLAKQMRAMVSPGPGRLLVEWDYKSYHVLTTGFCAEDPDYMRMARLDMHSFVAGHALKLWDAGKIISEPDEALLDRFTWLKQNPAWKYVRDNQSKPTILGVGFGMGYRRLYQENLEHFAAEKDARRFWDLLRELFPRVFRWQERIKKQAHEQQYLKSPFGHIRRFYEVFRWDSKRRDWASGDQAEEAVAFLPANIAFGNIRETMKDLRKRKLCFNTVETADEQPGMDARYGLCNNVHDSLLFNIADRDLEQHIADVHPILVAPSRVLRHPTICPDGLVIDVEGSAGKDWAAMEPIQVAVRA